MKFHFFKSLLLYICLALNSVFVGLPSQFERFEGGESYAEENELHGVYQMVGFDHFHLRRKNPTNYWYTKLCNAIWFCNSLDVREVLIRDEFDSNFRVCNISAFRISRDTITSTPLLKAIDYLHKVRDLTSNNLLSYNEDECVRELRTIIRFLLIYHADPNRLDSSGQNALHRAAYYGDTDLLKLLVSRSANSFLKTKPKSRICSADKSVTARVIALQQGHFEAASYLASVMEQQGGCCNLQFWKERDCAEKYKDRQVIAGAEMKDASADGGQVAVQSRALLEGAVLTVNPGDDEGAGVGS